MTEFRVKAIPTKYRGRLYRSRLEARWAAFFDRLGFVHEYEPFDLGAWSPDFLVLSPTGGEMLVEVKPTTTFMPEKADTMVRACFDNGIHDDILGLLFLGVKPSKAQSHVSLGWIASLCSDKAKATWTEAILAWVPHPSVPGLHADMATVEDNGPEGISWHSSLLGCYGEGVLPQSLLYPDHGMQLWAEASNAVQWLGRERQA